jgi:hypothetical protein
VSSGGYASPNPDNAASSIGPLPLNTNCPSTRTRNARPLFSNSQAYSPPRVGSRRLMHLCVVRYCGTTGRCRPAKYAGVPTTAERMCGPIRTATMPCATCSPTRTPASNRSATISVSP